MITEKNFNSRCSKVGADYENVVLSYEMSQNGASLLGRDVLIPDAGIEMDMIMEVLRNREKTYKFIQAKGGRVGEGKYPGAKRTDSVKKAIADGTLLKSTFPDSWYTVYFSDPPKPGSSSELMIKAAVRSGVLNEVQYLDYCGVQCNL